MELLIFLMDIAKPKINIYNDPKQESKHMYLVVNNFYGYAMTKFFQQVDSNRLILKSLTWINSSKGCFLEVDLEYPKELHKLHSDYHLAPGKIDIKKEILPEYQLKIADLYSIPFGKKC